MQELEELPLRFVLQVQENRHVDRFERVYQQWKRCFTDLHAIVLLTGGIFLSQLPEWKFSRQCDDGNKVAEKDLNWQRENWLVLSYS